MSYLLLPTPLHIHIHSYASDLINDTIADEIFADFPDGVRCRVSTILSSTAKHSHCLAGTSPRSTILLEQLPTTSCLCKLFNCKKGIFKILNIPTYNQGSKATGQQCYPTTKFRTDGFWPIASETPISLPPQLLVPSQRLACLPVHLPAPPPARRLAPARLSSLTQQLCRSPR
jgi:hypothetical protein